MLFHGCSALFVEIHAEGEIDLVIIVLICKKKIIYWLCGRRE